MIFHGFGYFGYIYMYIIIVLYNLRTPGGQLGLRKSRETRLRTSGECHGTPRGTQGARGAPGGAQSGFSGFRQNGPKTTILNCHT